MVQEATEKAELYVVNNLYNPGSISLPSVIITQCNSAEMSSLQSFVLFFTDIIKNKEILTNKRREQTRVLKFLFCLQFYSLLPFPVKAQFPSVVVVVV